MAATKVLNWTVYVLKCPRTREVRYVGWTNKTVDVRLRKHLQDALRKPHQNHRYRWIMSLVSIGLHPLIEVVESGLGDGWADAERRWIACYRANGARLVNGTDGGNGAPGCVTPERRSEFVRKWQAAKTPEQRSESAKKANAVLTPQQRSERARKRQAAKTPEQRSQSLRKRHAATTPEQRSEILRKANAARPPEQRSEERKKAWITRKSR